MADLNRREFMVAAAAATAACAMCCGHEAEAQTTAPTTQGSTVDVGAKTDYAADGMQDKFIATHKLVVTRENGQIFASSSTCTHMGGTVKIQGDTLYCPRHKSVFTPEGTNVSGPAKLPLPRYAISVDANGHLIVDTSKQFKTAADWKDPASFVTV